MVFTNFPKYEELKREEQQLYNFDKDTYNKSARKGGKAFYFASSGTTGETWVPLIEKAYAKLHGNYSHLKGGHECDAIADMTGFVILSASLPGVSNTKSVAVYLLSCRLRYGYLAFFSNLLTDCIIIRTY